MPCVKTLCMLRVITHMHLSTQCSKVSLPSNFLLAHSTLLTYKLSCSSFTATTTTTTTTTPSPLSSALFSLPSLMDARSFTSLVHRCGAKLSSLLEQQYIKTCEAAGLLSKATIDKCRERAREECKLLCSLRQVDVEDVVFNQYGLHHERLATCLVPYQVAVNIILRRLPTPIRSECVNELRMEEEAITNKRELVPHKWIQWEEKDLYVKDGLWYLRSIHTHAIPRIPIFALMGHINHGKSTLLELLTRVEVTTWESNHITQNVRSFTVSDPDKAERQFTFIDTPGHRVFVETRFHMQLVCDYVLLVISIVDGVEGQVYEIVKSALNLDKPIVVVLNKMDLLAGSLKAAERVCQVVLALHEIGLEVSMVHNKTELDALLYGVNTKQTSNCATKAKNSNTNTSAKTVATVTEISKSNAVCDCAETTMAQKLFAPVHTFDSTYQGSRRHPRIDLRRRCIGLCISARHGTRCELLWDVLRAIQSNTIKFLQLSPSHTSSHCESYPVCWSRSANWHEYNTAVQAIVVEASKHLFDDDTFRFNSSKQRIQRKLDNATKRKDEYFASINVPDRIHAMHEVHRRRARAVNRTSTSTLVIQAIVTHGTITRGMHFVADQAEGCVEHLLDHHGQQLSCATPGMAVTMVDTHSCSGLPWTGIHLLSTIDQCTRFSIHAYRQQLQWFIEVFPHKLHYLRPRHMDVAFAHLGDYGQLQITDSLEAQLVYGVSAKEHAQQQQRVLREGASVAVPLSTNTPNSTQSLAFYLADKNEKSEVDEEQKLLGRPVHYHAPLLIHCKPKSNHLLLEEYEEEQYSLSESVSRSSCIHQNALQICEKECEATKRTSQNIMSADEASALELLWRSKQLQHLPETQEEYKELINSCIQVGVLLFVDNWHSGRLFSRLVERLGTQRIRFNILGVRFGQPHVDQLRFFGYMAKIILCYRVPRNDSVEVDDYVESTQQWMLEADHFADVITFCKWCAITLEEEKQQQYPENTNTTSFERGNTNINACKTIEENNNTQSKQNTKQIESTQDKKAIATEDNNSSTRTRKLLYYKSHSGSSDYDDNYV